MEPSMVKILRREESARKPGFIYKKTQKLLISIRFLHSFFIQQNQRQIRISKLPSHSLRKYIAKIIQQPHESHTNHTIKAIKKFFILFLLITARHVCKHRGAPGK